VALEVDGSVLLLDVEFTEEVEGDHSVDVHDDAQQHQCQQQLKQEDRRTLTLDLATQDKIVNLAFKRFKEVLLFNKT